MARAGSGAVMFAVQSGGGAKEEEAAHTFSITRRAAKFEQPQLLRRGGCLLP